jgi:uncharacterized peroxidase-related enzyme
MAHIPLPEGIPGIRGPMTVYPETAKHLNGLAESLLRGPCSLTEAEREIIATYVSSGNDCYFCTQSHAATARHLLGPAENVVDAVLAGAQAATISPKLQALLTIADKVRRDGRQVTAADVQHARAAGADDQAIHHTVLIAAAFCMFNRYVDGLATFTPQDPDFYRTRGAYVAEKGYVAVSQEYAKP